MPHNLCLSSYIHHHIHIKGLRGQAQPIVIIIITVIIISITISRASYYPPPCFPTAKSKVLRCQPYKLGMMPRCHIEVMGTFVIWRFTLKPPSIWREGFAGWIQRWSMIWIKSLFPCFPFHCQREIWFLVRTEAQQSACLKAFLHPQIHPELHKLYRRVPCLGLTGELALYHSCETLNRRNLIRCLFEWDPNMDIRSFSKKSLRHMRNVVLATLTWNI